MFYVMWWNANGDCQLSPLMARADAEVFAAAMWPEQEARLMYVNR